MQKLLLHNRYHLSTYYGKEELFEMRSNFYETFGVEISDETVYVLHLVTAF